MAFSDRDPTKQNHETYDRIAQAYQERTRDSDLGAVWVDRLAAKLSPGALIADLGAGPGRDSAELRARGFQTVGMDLSMGMLRAGEADFPGPRVQSDLRALPFIAHRFDAVWANACLLHLRAEEMPGVLEGMARLLRPGGRLHVTIKQGVGDEWETDRYGLPRWFQYWEAGPFDSLLARVGFEIEEAHFDTGRRDVWIFRQCILRDRPDPTR